MFDSELGLSSKYFSIEEVYEKLSKLDDATWAKLMKAAESISYFNNISAEDLLQDVFDKLLSKKRSWPKNLDIFILFWNIMKSLLSNEKRKNKKEISLNTTNENGDELINTISDKKIDIEQEQILKQKKEEILNHFNEDDIAKIIVEGRIDNLKKNELLELTELSSKEYDTKWKMIRRRIAKEYPGGWQ